MRTVSTFVVASLGLLAAASTGASAQLTSAFSAAAAESVSRAALAALENVRSPADAFAAATVVSLGPELPGSPAALSAQKKASACASVRSLAVAQSEASAMADDDGEGAALAVAAGGRLGCEWATSPPKAVAAAVQRAAASQSVPAVLAGLLANSGSGESLLKGRLGTGAGGAAAKAVQMLAGSFGASGEAAWMPLASGSPPRSAAAAGMALRAMALLVGQACQDGGAECDALRQLVARSSGQASARLLETMSVAGPGSDSSSLSLEVSDWIPGREQSLGDAVATDASKRAAEAFWASRGSPAQATGALACGLMDLHRTTGTDLDVAADQLAGLAEALVLRATEAATGAEGRLQDAASAIEGLVALTRKNSVAVPVALEVVPAKGDRMGVRVSDALGKPLADAGECVLRAQSARELSGTGAGQEESDDIQIDLEFALRKKSTGSDTVFVAKGLSKTLGAGNAGGTFEVDLTFAPPDSPKAGPPLHTVEAAPRVVRIPLEASIADGQILVSTSSRATDEGAVQSRSDVDGLGGRGVANVKAGPAHFIHVLFRVSTNTGLALHPHQAVVRLSPRGSSAERHDAFFSARVVDEDEGKGAERQSVLMRATVNVGDRRELGKAASGGAFDASLIVGDARLHKGVELPLGLITLETPAPPPAQEEILYSKPLLHESDTATAPLREIVHQFNPPERQPPIIVPLAVTGALGAALVLFVGTVGALGHKWRSPGLAGAGMLVVVGGMLGVLGLYFFQVGPIDNAFSALGFLGVLTLPGLFVGRAALGALATEDA